MSHLYDGMTMPAGGLLHLNPGRIPPGMASVNGQFLVPRDYLRPSSVVLRDAVRHPRRVQYAVPAQYRAAAFTLTHPGTTLTGFGALALYGLPYLADAHDVVLIAPKSRMKKLGGQFSPTLTRQPLGPGETWNVVCRGEPIQVAAPAVAAAQALRLIRIGECSWPVVAPADEEVFVRAVQLVDTCRRFLGIAPEAIAAASRGRVDNRWLASVLKASSALADSPKETEMRLLASKVAKDYGVELREQLEFVDRGKLVTRADLAFPGPRVALYYDGANHDDPGRRIKDTRIDLYLTSIAWRPLRFGTNMLGGVAKHLAVVLEERGCARFDGRKI